MRAEVPVEAPDTLPSWFFDPENVDTLDVARGSTVENRVLVVMFNRTATQEMRQVAVDSIGGAVVGGAAAGGSDRYYLVDIGRADIDSLSRAAATLLSLPGVTAAAPYVVGSLPTYMHPNDGTHFSKFDWNTRETEDSFTGPWNGINAPLAWGCDTGSAATRLAIIGQASIQHTVHDLVDNLDQVHSTGWKDEVGTTHLDNHDARVLSIMAAVGNNGTGVTGMMWHATVGLYKDFAPGGVQGDMVQVASSIYNASADGARVINISRGYYGEMPQAAKEQIIGLFAERIRKAAADYGAVPVLVIAAGNNSSETDPTQTKDATSSIYPLLRDSFPDQVLVVGGAIRSNGQWTRWLGSNVGSRVDLYAPAYPYAENMDGSVSYVTSWSGDVVENTNLPQHGTSYAAPFVSGTAGLLFSFEPTLTASEVVTFIRNSANASVQGTGGKNLLDAYGALELAASHPGAPICGNRIWGSGAGIYVKRGNATELLGSVPSGVVEWISPMHGGHRVLLMSSDYEYYTLAFDGGAWALESPTDADWAASPGGALSSGYGISHDQAKIVTPEGDPDGEATDLRMTFWFDSTTDTLLQERPSFVVGRAPTFETSSEQTECAIQQRDDDGNWNCAQEASIPQGATYFSTASSITPEADTAFLVLSRRQLVLNGVSGWGPCALLDTSITHTDPSILRCRVWSFTDGFTGTDIYKMPVPSGSTDSDQEGVLDRSISGYGVNALTMSEDRKQFLAFLTTQTVTVTYQFNPNTWDMNGSFDFGDVCMLRYIDRATNGTTDLSTTQGCWNNGTGGFGASRTRNSAGPRRFFK